MKEKTKDKRTNERIRKFRFDNNLITNVNFLPVSDVTLSDFIVYISTYSLRTSIFDSNMSLLKFI